MYQGKIRSLWNAAFDQEAISTQELFMITLIPPTPHHLAGHELFDFIPEYHTR
jgi:hypothetical protein